MTNFPDTTLTQLLALLDPTIFTIVNGKITLVNNPPPTDTTYSASYQNFSYN